jgi:hypothetical protein
MNQCYSLCDLILSIITKRVFMAFRPHNHYQKHLLDCKPLNGLDQSTGLDAQSSSRQFKQIGNGDHVEWDSRADRVARLARADLESLRAPVGESFIDGDFVITGVLGQANNQGTSGQLVRSVAVENLPNLTDEGAVYTPGDRLEDTSDGMSSRSARPPRSASASIPIRRSPILVSRGRAATAPLETAEDRARTRVEAIIEIALIWFDQNKLDQCFDQLDRHRKDKAIARVMSEMKNDGWMGQWWARKLADERRVQLEEMMAARGEVEDGSVGADSNTAVDNGFFDELVWSDDEF